jgi:hypothetical protein
MLEEVVEKLGVGLRGGVVDVETGGVGVDVVDLREVPTGIEEVEKLVPAPPTTFAEGLL